MNFLLLFSQKNAHKFTFWKEKLWLSQRQHLLLTRLISPHTSSMGSSMLSFSKVFTGTSHEEVPHNPGDFVFSEEDSANNDRLAEDIPCCGLIELKHEGVRPASLRVLAWERIGARGEEPEAEGKAEGFRNFGNWDQPKGDRLTEMQVFLAAA